MHSARQLRKKARYEARKFMTEINSIGNDRSSSGPISEREVNSVSFNLEHEEGIEHPDFEEENEELGEISNFLFEDSDNSEEEIEDSTNEGTFSEQLCKWAVKNNISNSSMNELLEILNKHNINVPKDVRTLKKTPTMVEQKAVGGGIYIHYGLETALTDYLLVNGHHSEEIELDFNVDGLPLFKSSSKQVWPILGSVGNLNHVFLVGVFEGNSKPHTADLFLETFVEEMIEVSNRGISFVGRHYRIKIRSFIMDAPATSFVLGVKGHSGYYSCGKCLQKGEIVKNRLVFRFLEHVELRTNTSFRSRAQPQHHKIQQKNSHPILVVYFNSNIFEIIFILFINNFKPLKRRKKQAKKVQ